jgi:hypothetical protein
MSQFLWGKSRLGDLCFGAVFLAVETYQIATSGRIDLFFSVVGLSLLERGFLGYAPAALSTPGHLRARLWSGSVLLAIWLALLAMPFIWSVNVSWSRYLLWLVAGIVAGVGASVLLSSAAWIKYESKPAAALYSRESGGA